MSDLQHILDHVERARAKLIGQYAGRPRLQALIDAFSHQIQDIEDAIYDMWLRRLLENAEDKQLDNIGEIVGYKRAGSEDEEYRLLLSAKIRVNLANGRISELLRILDLVTGQPISAREYYPAAIEFEVSGAPSSLNARRLFINFLKRAKAGGVSLRLRSSDKDSSVLFEFSDGTDDASDTQGFEDSVSSTGGGDLTAVYG